MVIISDWNQELKAYSIPKDLVRQINNYSKEIDFKFLGDIFNYSDVEVYFGNLPKESALSKFENLKWVHFGSIGIDKISQAFIENNKLTITNGANTNTKAVVTYCMGELFHSCKAGFLSRVFDESELTRLYYNNFYDHMIDYDDIKLTILGYGGIGQKLAQMLSPLVKTINIVTRTKRPSFKNIKFFSLDEIVVPTSQSTHIINVLPLHDKTMGIINQEVCKHLNAIYYICAGRAETHVVDDILSSIDNGRIRGASLDVHGLPGGKIDESIMKYNKIKLSPHISGWTKNFWENQKEIIMHNLDIFSLDNHEKMKNLVYNKGIKS